jgi:hypothetical protein
MKRRKVYGAMKVLVPAEPKAHLGQRGYDEP